MTLPKLYLIFFISTIFSGCTAYAPVGDYGGFPHGGYTSSSVDGNSQIVGFNGNILTSPMTARRYMLYRSAVVTLDSGYDYFVITSSSYSPNIMHIKTEDTYNDYNSDPPQLHNVFSRTVNLKSYFVTRTNLEYAGSNGCRISTNGAVSSIKMFKGTIPRGMPYAYYARDVISHLGDDTFGATTY